MKILTTNNLLTFFYSLFFNIKYLPFKYAMRVPILISPKVKIERLCRGGIVFEYEPKYGDIRIGLNASRGYITKMSYLSISRDGRLTFRGRVKLSAGISIRIDKGNLTFGAKTFVNGNCMFRCTKSIILGDELLVGWNVNFSTDDGHYIIENNKIKLKEKDINVGRHVWIASDTKIAKGVKISNDSVVAQNSLVTSQFFESNILIAGIPAKIVKNNINWKK